MAELTLLRSGNRLANPREQVSLLESDLVTPAFQNVLSRHGCHGLRATTLQVLQINVGRVCNQTCTHCHVDAGPDRREYARHCVFNVAVAGTVVSEGKAAANRGRAGFAGLIFSTDPVRVRLRSSGAPQLPKFPEARPSPPSPSSTLP